MIDETLDEKYAQISMCHTVKQSNNLNLELNKI